MKDEYDFSRGVKGKERQNGYSKRKIVMEGTVFGAIASLSVGLFISFLNWVLFVSDGYGSMLGMTYFTIEAILAGAITGSIVSYLLARQSLPLSDK